MPLLVPREQFQLCTGLPPAAVWARLTLPGQAFVAGSPGADAVDFYSDDFDLHRVAAPGSWWALQPQISGVIAGTGDPTDSGCLIAVRVEPAARVALLCAGGRVVLIAVSILLVGFPQSPYYAFAVEPAARVALLCAGGRVVLIAVSILLVGFPQSPYYAFALIGLVAGLLLNNVFVGRFQRTAAAAKAYLVETLRDYPLPQPDEDHNTGPLTRAAAPTQRLPRRWVGGTAAAQRYGWGVESPPSLPPAADGAEHETQRLPAGDIRGD